MKIPSEYGISLNGNSAESEKNPSNSVEIVLYGIQLTTLVKGSGKNGTGSATLVLTITFLFFLTYLYLILNYFLQENLHSELIIKEEEDGAEITDHVLKEEYEAKDSGAVSMNTFYLN